LLQQEAECSMVVCTKIIAWEVERIRHQCLWAQKLDSYGLHG